MCNVLGISSSGFYYWLSAPQAKNEKSRLELLEEIRSIYESSHRIYGSPRITAELNRRGRKISRPYVARLMKEMNIRSKIRRKFRVTTDSDHTYLVAENLLQRDFSADALSKKWVGDITYIRVNSGWLYLTTVIDLADRKVIGWSFSEDMSAENTSIAALRMAIKNRGVKEGLIFHSDRGVQYACNPFKLLLEKEGILPSMSRKGDCWDNAVAESFFKTLKCELVYHRKFSNKGMARLEVFRYIEGFYNKERRHSSLGYLTPNEMEKLLINLQPMAA